MMNLRTRQYKEALMEVTNQFEDLPIEVRLTCLQLLTNKVTEMANDAVLKEIQDAESVHEDKLGELPK